MGLLALRGVRICRICHAKGRIAADATRTIYPASPEAGEEYRTANLEFHRAVHLAANSDILARKQEIPWMKADFFVTHAANFREHTSESANEHELVIEAIAAQDGERARALMEDHITLLGKYVVEHLSDDQGQLAEVV